MTARKRKYGLIGFPLSHSFSPSYFEKKFESEKIDDAEYKAYPLESIESLCDLIDTGIDGLNVTIPYKEFVIPYLDDLSEAAEKIGAVNTIKVENGQLTGHNTDVIGFKSSLEGMLDGESVNRALILGTGGAAKAVAYVLDQLGIAYLYVSRKETFLQYADLNQKLIEEHRLIINTTPLGMAPHTDLYPNIPYTYITEQHFLYDLIYNPEKTIFLNKGAEAGATIKNGYDMLIRQAEASWKIWNQQQK